MTASQHRRALLLLIVLSGLIISLQWLMDDRAPREPKFAGQPAPAPA
jgi:hypothetical protein